MTKLMKLKLKTLPASFYSCISYYQLVYTPSPLIFCAAFLEFAKRIAPYALNKKNLVHLCRAGAQTNKNVAVLQSGNTASFFPH